MCNVGCLLIQCCCFRGEGGCTGCLKATYLQCKSMYQEEVNRRRKLAFGILLKLKAPVPFLDLALLLLRVTRVIR